MNNLELQVFQHKVKLILLQDLLTYVCTYMLIDILNIRLFVKQVLFGKCSFLDMYVLHYIKNPLTKTVFKNITVKNQKIKSVTALYTHLSTSNFNCCSYCQRSNLKNTQLKTVLPNMQEISGIKSFTNNRLGRYRLQRYLYLIKNNNFYKLNYAAASVYVINYINCVCISLFLFI